MITDQTFDVAVIGAGVFGAWTTLQLSRSGARVALLDAYGPGNNRASSGGESRIIRMGYGPDGIYTAMAQRSLRLWKELSEQIGPDNTSTSLFQPTGVLWLARDQDSYCEATLENFRRLGVNFQRLEHTELARQYPQLQFGASEWGILEQDSGVLMSRNAVRATVAAARALGATYFEQAALPPSLVPGSGSGETLDSVETAGGDRLRAGKFVFACGPWLPKLFPDLLGKLIEVTRQEVFFFGVPASSASAEGLYGPARMPAWIDFNDLVYGIPNLDHRGIKIAIDAHGPQFDPDNGERFASKEGLDAARAQLARRIPKLAEAPVVETRVCQYENTSNGDFLIDRHPAYENVWLVGGGSGHGFKHGPAVGEHVAGLLTGRTKVELRFALATKESVHERKVY